MLLGLELAWEEGYMKVIVEGDSVTVISQESMTTSRNNTFLRHIRSICGRQWQIQFIHTVRDGNKCAD